MKQTPGNTKEEKGQKLFDDNYIFETTEEITVFPSFDDMGLREDLLKGIYAYGFDKPSAVQQRAIIPIIKGRDVIVQSQSGTGKTCVFSVGALQILDLNTREPPSVNSFSYKRIGRTIPEGDASCGRLYESSGPLLRRREVSN